MPTTVRLDPRTETLLQRLSKKSGLTKSQVIRKAIQRLAEAEGAAGTRVRPYDAIAHLIGRIKDGPPDLSERTGEKVRKLLAERARR
jgi:predicted transcriptional regulator